MTKYIDIAAEGNLRVDIYARQITNDPVPKFIIEGEPPAAPRLKPRKWRTPKLLEFAYPKQLKTPQDVLNWKRAFRLDPGGGNVGELSPTDHLIGCAIIEHRNRQTGQCNPAYDLLALGLGMHRNTIQRSVNKLVQRGWFHVERRKNKPNRFHPTYPAAIEAMLREFGNTIGGVSGNTISDSGNTIAVGSGNTIAVVSEPSREPTNKEPTAEARFAPLQGARFAPAEGKEGERNGADAPRQERGDPAKPSSPPSSQSAEGREFAAPPEAFVSEEQRRLMGERIAALAKELKGQQ